jgi:hypothetical protein
VRGIKIRKTLYLDPPHPNLIMPDCPVRNPAGKCKSAPGGFVPVGEGTVLDAEYLLYLNIRIKP